MTTITALPSAPSRSTDTPENYVTKADAMMAALPAFVTETNTVAGEVNTNATNTATNATAAAASATAAVSAANAAAWVSGNTYTTGQCVYSPIDFQTYRHITATSSLTTDPSLDTTNWVKLSGTSGITTVSSTVTTDATLTSASAGYQFVQMATMGKSLTLPDATTMTVGGPKFIVDNTQGSYPCGIRDSAGTLLMAVAAGGEAYVSIKSIATAAGAWSITGTNLEPGLITIDNTFSSAYSSTVLAPFVALDDNKSIHFLKNTSNDLYAVAVDKTTGAVGTPVLVKVATTNVRSAFKVSTTTAIAFYDDGSANSRAVIISLSGATTLAVGTEATVATYGYWSAENFSGAPKIAQLTSTLYLASYTSGTNTTVVAVSVSGTTITLGSPANIITANSVSNSTTTYALTATTGLVLYKSGAGAPYANNAVVISVSGTTCTVGTPAALTGVGSSLTAVASSCLLSATKCLVQDDNNTAGSVIASAFTISGTAVTAGTLVSVETGIATSSSYTADSATRYNPHLFSLSSSTALLWYLNSSSVSRAVVLSESGGTVTAGNIIYRSISVVGSGSHGAGIILPQGTSSFISLSDSGVADAWMRIASAHKINGTTITQGNSGALEGLTPKNAIEGNFQWARTQSGMYAVVGTNSNAHGGIGIPIFKTNGDAIDYRGIIAKPRNATSLANNIIPTIGERLVILFASAGTTVASTTFQLRLITVEIAA